MHKVLLFIATVLVCISSNAKEVFVKSTHEFEEQLKDDNTTYRIAQAIDLCGKSIALPTNCTLLFEDNGSLKNGILVGNKTKIKSSKHQIFGKGINVSGTWDNGNVYGEWAGLCEDKTNNESFSILSSLCKGSSYTHLYTPKGDYPVEAVVYSAPILLPSNVYWHNSSTIKLKACEFTHYSIVLIHNVRNVIIDGGHFIGDVNEHTDTGGEWGHGIKVGGATNVTLKNLTCSYCWGDGIDLIEGRDASRQPTIVCNTITIHNVKCLHNRRQGMSIEAAHNVKVTNCEFAYTGYPLITKPAAGLDIEEWNADSHKINHLIFKNCSFHDNAGFDLQTEPNRKMGDDEYLKFDNNIHFEKCTVDSCRVTYTNGITFNDCVIQDIKVHQSNDVNFIKCTIEKYVHSKNNKAPKIKKCKGKAIMLSYMLPISILGLTTILGTSYLVQIHKINEKSRNNHYS